MVRLKADPTRGAEHRGLLRAVGAADIDAASAATTGHPDPPRIAADLAVLNKGAAHVRLEVDLNLFAAVRTRDQELIVQLSYSTLPLGAAGLEGLPGPSKLGPYDRM